MVCTRYQQSAIAHGYVDSVTDVCSFFMDMCTNGTGAQCRSYFVVLSLNGYATHAIFDDHEKTLFYVYGLHHIPRCDARCSRAEDAAGTGAPFLKESFILGKSWLPNTWWGTNRT